MKFLRFFKKSRYDNWTEHIIVKFIMPIIFLTLVTTLIYGIYLLCTGQGGSGGEYTPAPVIIDGNVYVM
jgi:hypothetical protein